MIQARKFNRPMFPIKPDDESTNATTLTTSHVESECPSEIGDNNDDSVSVVSESANDAIVEKPPPKKLGRPRKNDPTRCPMLLNSFFSSLPARGQKS
jgi:hypothetical protein